MTNEDQSTSTSPTDAIQQASYGRLPPSRGKVLGISDELWAPVILIGASQLIWLGVGFYFAGTENLVLGIFASLLLAIQGVVSTAVAIAACFLVALIFGTSFGLFSTALPKLAAATMFPLAVAMLLLPVAPFLSCLSLFFLTLSLLKGFFDLNFLELIAMVLAESFIAAMAVVFLGLL